MLAGAAQHGQCASERFGAPPQRLRPAHLMPSGSLNPRLEASGVLATGELFYVIFDNLPHIACISPELSPAAGGNRLIVAERGLRSGFEDIAHDPQAARFYVLIESLPRGLGLFMAAVQ